MKLFSYGTLQDTNIQHQILGRKLQRYPAFLNGWKRVKIFTDDAYYWAIKPGKGQVWGSILEVKLEDLIKLDEYEGSAYRQKTTRTSDGELVTVYILANGYSGNPNQNQKTSDKIAA